MPGVCTITDGKQASQQICQYVVTLMSTYNPCPPDSHMDNAVFRLQWFTEVAEFAHLGEHFPCVNAT